MALISRAANRSGISYAVANDVPQLISHKCVELSTANAYVPGRQARQSQVSGDPFTGGTSYAFTYQSTYFMVLVSQAADLCGISHPTASGFLQLIQYDV